VCRAIELGTEHQLPERPLGAGWDRVEAGRSLRTLSLDMLRRRLDCRRVVAKSLAVEISREYFHRRVQPRYQAPSNGGSVLDISRRLDPHRLSPTVASDGAVRRTGEGGVAKGNVETGIAEARMFQCVVSRHCMDGSSMHGGAADPLYSNSRNTARNGWQRHRFFGAGLRINLHLLRRRLVPKHYERYK